MQLAPNKCMFHPVLSTKKDYSGKAPGFSPGNGQFHRVFGWFARGMAFDRGCQVTVLEALDRPGGRTHTFAAGPFAGTEARPKRAKGRWGRGEKRRERPNRGCGGEELCAVR